MDVDAQTWTDLGSMWDGYKKSVDKWLTAAPSGVGTDEVDRLIHEVIHAHNDWSEKLGKVVEATHHH
jgi:hypothetical protein